MPRVVRCLVLVLSLLSLPSQLLALPSTIDFESLAEDDVLASQFPGVSFSSGIVQMAGSHLNENELPPHSGSNVVFDDVGPITISFVSPVSNVGGYFTYATPVVVQAFGIANNLLGSRTSLFSNNLLASGDIGSSPNELLQFGFGGISRVTITGDAGGSSFVLDDFTYTPTATTVPEPTTLGLVLLGVVARLRTRRTRNRRPKACG